MTKLSRRTPRVPHTLLYDRLVPAVLALLFVLLVVVMLAVVFWPLLGPK